LALLWNPAKVPRLSVLSGCPDAMKKLFSVFFFILAYCLLILPSVAAQTPREVRIYVPPVSGEGRSGDSNFFYQQLTYEVIFQHLSLVRSQKGSDFTLRGIIAPEAERDSRNYVFYLEMINSYTDEVIAQQSIVYANIGSNVIELISAMVYNMLSTVPSFSGSDDWRDNHLFIGANAIWQPRLYLAETGNQSIYWMNFGIGFNADYYFLDFMAVSAGFQFSQDWLILSSTNNSTIDYRDLIIEIPVAIKFSFRPGDILLEPYTGLSFNISVNQVTQPSVLSWIIGLQFGLKAGPGSIVIDPRLSLDLLPSTLPLSGVNSMAYNRYTIQFGIGYKFGFIPKRNVRDY